MAKFSSWDDYLLPGTDVLRNIPGFTDKAKLDAFEERAVFLRMAEVHSKIEVTTFDYKLMKAIHGWVFQDVYEWAGQPRVGPEFPSLLTKVGPSVSGGPGSDPASETEGYFYESNLDLERSSERNYRALAEKENLVGLDRATFVSELAEIWSEINYVHVFREGNTRTQFVFFKLLSENAGYSLDTALFHPGRPLQEEFIRARFYALLHDSSWLSLVLSAAVHDLSEGPQLTIDDEVGEANQPREKDVGVSKDGGRYTSKRRPDAANGLT